MYYELTVARRHCEYEIKCASITEAYHYYLRHFSTIGDWLYYLKTAHAFLHKVIDEDCMLAIFDNVFTDAFIITKKEN